MAVSEDLSLDNLIAFAEADFEKELLSAELLTLIVVANAGRKLRKSELLCILKKLAEKHELFGWFRHATRDDIDDIVETPYLVVDVYDIVNYRISLNERGRRLYEQLSTRIEKRMFESMVSAIKEVARHDC